MGSGEEFEAVLREVAEAHGLPGAAAAVLAGDQIHVAMHGVTNVEYPQPVSAASLFQVGSITKTFTSAAAMVLVEEGRLRLEDSVSKYLPDLAAATGLDLDSMTIEHVLSHQGGFDGDHLLTNNDGTDLLALANARRLFAPGDGYSYCNAGFSIAGAVIEAASGQRFASFVHQRLLRPLGMRSASFEADRAITYQVAAPHWVADGAAFVIRGGGWQPGWQLEPVDWPAGGLIASVEQLLDWCRFQRTGAAEDGTVLLRRESLDRLHGPVVNADLLDDVALDWVVRPLDGVRSIGHGGLTAGYCSDLVIVPDRDFAFVGLTNAAHGSMVNAKLRRWALHEFAGITERDPAPDPSVHIEPSRFDGRYLDPFAILTVTAGSTPDTLLVTASPRDDLTRWQPPVDPPQTVAFITEEQGVTIDSLGPQHVARFGFGDDGRVAWLLWNGRRAVRL